MEPAENEKEDVQMDVDEGERSHRKIPKRNTKVTKNWRCYNCHRSFAECKERRRMTKGIII